MGIIKLASIVTAVLVIQLACTNQGVLAMHDSTLDVNTWIASNNSTQLNTIDLNSGPVSPTATTGGGETEEEEEVEEEPEEPSADGDEQDEQD